jgi:hypothetical protein
MGVLDDIGRPWNGHGLKIEKEDIPQAMGDLIHEVLRLRDIERQLRLEVGLLRSRRKKMPKPSYIVNRRNGVRWQVLFVPTGRSVRECYTRKEARDLARRLNLEAARCDSKELEDAGRNESLR